MSEQYTRSQRIAETFMSVYGVVMFFIAASVHDWGFAIVMGIALIISLLVYQWRSPTKEVIFLPKPSRHAQLRANGGSHTAAEWWAVCERCDWRCVSCGKRKPLTKDHIIPVIQGGTDDIENIQPLCRHCNSSKHGMAMLFKPYRRETVIDGVTYQSRAEAAAALGISPQAVSKRARKDAP